MNKTEIFESLVVFRKGPIANGVRAELDQKTVPESIKNMIAQRKSKKKN